MDGRAKLSFADNYYKGSKRNSPLFLPFTLKSNNNFRIVGTTADIAVVAYGESLQKLFAHAAEGLIFVFAEPDQIEKIEKRVIKLPGSDIENLMVKWLNEILYFFEVKEFLGKEFKILTLDENHLHAEIAGETYKREKHLIKTEIKAVTYHQLAIKQQKGKWKAKIIFDL